MESCYCPLIFLLFPPPPSPSVPSSQPRKDIPLKVNNVQIFYPRRRNAERILFESERAEPRKAPQEIWRRVLIRFTLFKFAFGPEWRIACWSMGVMRRCRRVASSSHQQLLSASLCKDKRGQRLGKSKQSEAIFESSFSLFLFVRNRK